MTRKKNNNLTKEKLQQLLAAVGYASAQQQTQVEAQEYNWSEPHCFSSEQLAKLGNFAEKVKVAIAEVLCNSLRSKFDVKVSSTTQHYADEFAKANDEKSDNDYYLTFGTDIHKPFGLIGLMGITAITWSKYLLGDSESEENSDTGLSQLEKSLLSDLLFVIVKAFVGIITNNDLNISKTIKKGQWPVENKNTNELCKISFEIKKESSVSDQNSSVIYFIVPCDWLEPVVGKRQARTTNDAAQDTPKVIIEHIQRLPVYVTVQLGSSRIGFEDVMNLQADDIVMLNKKVHEPVELITNGKTTCYGWLAKSDGRYAVKISERAY